MKIGFLTNADNINEYDYNQPVWHLRNALIASGHEVTLLDTHKAEWDNGVIIYPELSANDRLDLFIGYYPEDGAKIPYFDQLKHLSDRFNSPVPYDAQNKALDKTQLIKVFGDAGLPKPISYDGNNLNSREKVLTEIEKTKRTFVLKPDFGGSGCGIIKVDTVEDARRAFKDFDDRKEPFMMQHYIDTRDENGISSDYRAYVVGDKVLAGIKRTATEGQWKTNLALGSTVTPHFFTPQQERDAVKAMQQTGLAFGGVDILIDRQSGQHYICEVNDACSGTESIESAHPNIDVAKSIVQMLEDKYAPTQPASP